MKQKFRKLSFVHVTKYMPPHMAGFDNDFDAIVEGTYSQLYGGRNIIDYSLFKIKEGKIIDQVGWYEEGQLILLPEQDTLKAENMIEEYNFSLAEEDEDE